MQDYLSDSHAKKFMNAGTIYRQCRIVRSIPQGESVRTSWLPSSVAAVGRTIRLKDAAGIWQDGWVVRNVGITRRETDLRSTPV